MGLVAATLGVRADAHGGDASADAKRSRLAAEGPEGQQQGQQQEVQGQQEKQQQVGQQGDQEERAQPPAAEGVPGS
jgi:hypothetical protein